MFREETRFVTTHAPMTVVTEILPATFPIGGEPVINLRLSAAEGELVVRFTRLDVVGEVTHQLQVVLADLSVLSHNPVS